MEAFGIREGNRALNPAGAMPRPITFAPLPELIALSVKKNPNYLAIVAEEDSITYAVLDARSNSLASALRSLGVGRDIVVGVHLPNSIAFVVAALGIMKAGGAYLPLGFPRQPDRLAFQLADSRAQILIVSEGFELDPQRVSARSVLLTATGELLQISGLESTASRIDIDDLAYVIYTSGSTGRPKGVEIPHRGLANLISWHCRSFQITTSDRASLLSRPEFDAAVWELWPYLAAGASVHIPESHLAKDSELLCKWLIEQQITIAFAPSPLAEQLMTLKWPLNSRLRILLTGADVLHRYPPPGLPFQVFNNYGPTECTVVATSTCLPALPDSDHLPPIGKEIAGTKVYVLDENKKPVTPGYKGEIWIAGLGLARGYRNDPALTAAKFQANPFSAAPGARIYRSGDLGSVNPEGQLSLLGRADDQIKIRGIRIEPAEIELVLDDHRDIYQSAVLLRKFPNGEDGMVAFLVVDPEHPPMLEDVRAFLSRKLPEYMIPSAFVNLDRLPLTSAGKIDRTSLRMADFNNSLTDATEISSHSSAETRLAQILARLLGLKEVSVSDNFFNLGGHSLLGTQLIARIRDAFGVEVSLRFLFESPTIAAIAAEVERLLILRLERETDEDAHRFAGLPSQGHAAHGGP